MGNAGVFIMQPLYAAVFVFSIILEKGNRLFKGNVHHFFRSFDRVRTHHVKQFEFRIVDDQVGRVVGLRQSE